MTAICTISKENDLSEIYNKLKINDVIKFIQYKGNPNKGVSHKEKKQKRKNKVVKNFYNQLTIHIFNEKIINVKVFNNGKVQMTGIKQEQQGINTVNILINELNKCIPNLELNLKNYEIVLINTDFDIRYKIIRE